MHHGAVLETGAVPHFGSSPSGSSTSTGQGQGQIACALPRNVLPSLQDNSGNRSLLCALVVCILQGKHSASPLAQVINALGLGLAVGAGQGNHALVHLHSAAAAGVEQRVSVCAVGNSPA